VKVVVGIDESPASQTALALLRRMKFEAVEVVLVHAIESILPDGSFIENPAHPVGRLLQESKRFGTRILREAQSQVAEDGIEAQVRLCLGSPAEKLMSVATEVRAGMIVVGRNRRSAWEDLILGSTARNLLHEWPGHLLVAHGPPANAQGLRVLLAVDQRFGTEAFVDAFAGMRPTGIATIELVTVNCVDDAEARRLVRGLPVTTEVAEGWITSGLRHANALLTDRLATLGAQCVPRVVYGQIPEQELTELAVRTAADLIVVGAEPHGFLDRHLRRSVSEGLLAAGPRSLMVLRPRRGEE
jgi:nucleotide-binding universal stress UspA family protein